MIRARRWTPGGPSNYVATSRAVDSGTQPVERGDGAFAPRILLPVLVADCRQAGRIAVENADPSGIDRSARRIIARCAAGQVVEAVGVEIAHRQGHAVEVILLGGVHGQPLMPEL